VCLCDRERDRKAEAGTAAVHARAGVVGPPEALERIRKKLRWEAGSVVEHFDHRAAVFTRHPHGDRPTRRRVANRVGEQVDDCLPHERGCDRGPL